MSYGYGEFEGLESLAEIELSGESWEFDLLGIWKGEDGYYLGTDSGCSCPIPFENYQRENLTGPLTKAQAIEETNSLALGGYGQSSLDSFWEGQE